MNVGDSVVLQCPTPCSEGACPGCPQQVTVTKVHRFTRPTLQFATVALAGGGGVKVNTRWLTKGET